MTDNVSTLLGMITESDNPEQAMLIALEVIVGFLNHHESTESISSAELREHA